MPTSNGPNDPQAFKGFVWVLYVSLLSAVALYWVVVAMLFSEVEPVDLGVVKYALMTVAAGSTIAVLFIRFSLIAPLVRSTSPDLQRLRVLYILCYTLAESVALYGLVARFLGGTEQDFFVFYLTSIALFLVCYPRTPQTIASGPIG